jgi:hypothetical protein
MAGFEKVRMAGLSLETFKSGGQAVRGIKGQFTAYAETGRSKADVRAIFANMKAGAKASALAVSSGAFDDSIQLSGVTLSVSGFNQTLYAINYMEALFRNFKSYEPQFQLALQTALGEAIEDFVQRVVRPKAEEIIMQLVYTPAFHKLNVSMASRAAKRKRGSKYKDSDLRGGYKINPKTGEYYASSRASIEAHETGKTSESDRYSARRGRGVGFGAATWGESRQQQRLHRLGVKIGGILGHQETDLSSFASVSTLRPPFNYSGPTGRLLRSFMSGVRAVGTSIQIGIDPTLIGDVPYWLFVERGHGYKIPVGRTSKGRFSGRRMVWLPYREPPKPFLTAMNAWMLSEGRAALEVFLSVEVNTMIEEVGVLLQEAMAEGAIKVRALQGDMTGKYLRMPGRRFDTESVGKDYRRFAGEKLGGFKPQVVRSEPIFTGPQMNPSTKQIPGLISRGFGRTKDLDE